MQKSDRPLNTRTLVGQGEATPPREFLFASQRRLPEHFQRANDHMMGVGELEEILHLWSTKAPRITHRAGNLILVRRRTPLARSAP
jgi:hypothetical protein